tara:strand:- start:9869 stop:13318 length:3450 start_codon:yes stop_codon:yes gene_type:complete
MLLWPQVTKAQTLQDKNLSIDSVKADTAYYIGEWVLESSISVQTDSGEVPTQNWLYDPIRGTLSFRNTNEFSFRDIKYLQIEYKVYPYSLRRFYNDRAVQPLDTSLLNKEGDVFSRFNLNAENNRNNESDLQQRGSLSRGIIVGTNQDFALESGLDFELSGKLTDDITISAVLTDRSIPIQPDGTTQNLKEFDRVFIQVEAPSTTIEMGDVDISLEKSTFAKLNRRLQGAAGYNSTTFTDVAAAASVVRGVFKSVRFAGLEGVQGPYRLTGNENDEFVIILAGTERVYLNGKLVDRGEEEEYIIDYGLGELYFTNNLLIKDETRIVVEYEYIDQNFNRTLVAAEGEGKLLNDRFKIGATVIRQADGNNLLSQQTLTESDIDILRQAGDDRTVARVSGAEMIDPDDEDFNVLYTQIDTVVNGQTFIIFKNEPGSEEAVFRVRFSNVGEFQGSYQRVGTSVNGLLFKWVGPNQGEYEPFRTLPAPIQQQMAALNSSFLVNDNIKLFGEWAVSDYDQNRFSTLDDADNIDHSYLGGIQIDTLKAGMGSLSFKAERRYSGSNFEFFERTREVEFDRKWNLSGFEKSQETTNELSARYDFKRSSFINGEYGFIDRFGFTGERQAAAFQMENSKGLGATYSQDWIRSEDDFAGINGNWFRQQGRLSKQFNNRDLKRTFTPFIQFEHEERLQRDQSDDSLTNQSLRFYEIVPGVNYQSEKWLIGYSMGFRTDFRVNENRLEKESKALQHSVQLNVTPSNYVSTQNKITVRNKDFNAQFEENGNTDKRSLLIRSNTSYSSISDNWTGNFLYEANTQRQALLQETFIEVGPEIGQYVWDDLNNDGVEQVDEFFLEITPNEGTYIRQFLPSDDLFPVIDLKVRLRNEINPLGFMKGEEGVNYFLNQMVFRSRFDVAENSTTNDLADIYFLNLQTFRDAATTIQGRFTFEKELDVLPAYDSYDISVRYNQSRSLNRRSSELQRIFIDAFAVDFGYDITSTIQGDSKVSFGTNRTTSNTISNRNYDIYSQNFEQGFGATLNRSWRTGFVASYSNKKDRFQVNNTVDAQIVKIRNTNRFFLWRKMQANSSLEFRNVRVNGTTNAVGNFELTEGSGEGSNLLWSLNSSYRVSNLIRLNLVYDGRTVKDRPTIHTARLTVKAIF